MSRKPTDSKRLTVRPQFHKLKVKAQESHEELLHESQQSSAFNNLSAIQKIPSSKFSCGELDNTYKEVSNMMAATEEVGDLIVDGQTVLVFKEKFITTSFVDIEKTRFIIYQKGDSEGIIKIKEGNHTNKIDDDEEFQEPFTFRQCTFFFCDTTSKDGYSTKSYFEGIQILCSCPIRFIDCAFMGISYHKGGTKLQGVPFKAFTDYSAMVNLEFENCYFSGIQSVIYTNLPTKQLKLKQCTIDKMDADAILITHPTKLVVKDSTFLHCSAQAISVKIFEEEQQDKSVKRMSVFANSTRIDNSVVCFCLLSEKHTPLEIPRRFLPKLPWN